MKPESLSVRDLMTIEVVTFKRFDELVLADDLMKLGRIRHIPVVAEDGRRVVGILSQRDLLRAALIQSLAQSERHDEPIAKSVLVGDIMVSDVKTVTPEMSAAGAAQIMLEQKIGCLPVVGGNDGGLVGLLTESDFVRHVLRQEGGR
jgi:CBS domain-containing membrane protein